MKRGAITFGSAIVLCLGVIIMPFALMGLGLAPRYGVPFLIVSVALMAVGALGVVGYKRRSN